METVDKVVAGIVRRIGGEGQVLVFDHPSAGTQIIKGTVEPGESLEAALVREVREESGLVQISQGSAVGVWERLVGAGPNEDGPVELHRWHVFVCAPPADCQLRWDHVAEGSDAEDGLVFSFRWLLMSDAVGTGLHSLFGPVAEMIAVNVPHGVDQTQGTTFPS